jgi:exosortase D (VPLPA-CTERM-specific)
VSQHFDQHSTVFSLSRATWPVLLTMMVVATLVFHESIGHMVDVWIDSEEYSHSLLIPLIAAFLVWQRKDALERLRLDGAWAGVGVVVFGCVLQLIGRMATLFTVQQYALLIILYGAILALIGWRGIRLLAMPLLLLFLMIPLPPFLLYNLSAKLQLISTQIGVAFIRLAGVSVFVEGNVIDLGSYKLQVAEACSGLRYLFPLMTLGLIVGYFFKAPFWKRAVVFVSSIPLTILMNSFRIGMIGLLVDRWGTGMAEGFIHAFEGWIVFMACIGMLVLEVVLLQRAGGDRRPLRDVFGLDLPAPTPRSARRATTPLSKPLLTGAAIFIAFSIVIALLPQRIEAPPSRTAFANFPPRIDAWSGRQLTLDSVYLNALKLDDYVLADYSRDGYTEPVNFYVAWYNSQIGGEAVHSPRSCLPGGGWRITDFTQRDLSPLKVGLQPLRVNRVAIEYGMQRELVYYWFQQRGRAITNEYLVKWYLFVDALRLHRTDGALVRMVVSLRPDQTASDGDRELADFAAAVVPTLGPFVPD